MPRSSRKQQTAHGFKETMHNKKHKKTEEKNKKLRKGKEIITASLRRAKYKLQRESRVQDTENETLSQQNRSVVSELFGSDIFQNDDNCHSCKTGGVNEQPKSKSNGESEDVQLSSRSQTTARCASDVLPLFPLQGSEPHLKECRLLSMCTPTQVIESLRWPAAQEREDGNVRTISQAPDKVDKSNCAADDYASQNRMHYTQIKRSNEDRLLNISMTFGDIEERKSDAEGFSAYPAPVTRVDVIEAPPVEQIENTLVDRSQEANITIYQREGQDLVEKPACFTVPIIVVEDASSESHVSDYSEDIDAVAIDADEYLAFAHYKQSDNPDDIKALRSMESTHSQRFIRQGKTHVLTDQHRYTDFTLSVPADPKLSEERIPSRSARQTLRPDLNYTRRFSTPSALEVAGLRTQLIPSTYNVEFQSSTVLRPSTPRPDYTTSMTRQSLSLSEFTKQGAPADCSIARISISESPVQRTLSPNPQSPRDTTSSLFPSAPPGSGPCSLKSAMSSRRSSFASVGTAVHWDLALPYSSELSRQVSWSGIPTNSTDSKGTHSSVKRRHSSALGTRSERFPAAPHDFFNGTDLAEGHRTESSPSSRRNSMTTVSDMGIRRMSTASIMSSGRNRRTSKRGSVIEEELEGQDLLSRQTSQYDPKVEKSEHYNHQRENSFNKASQWLSPVRRGLRNLQVHYSKTNTTHNDGLIFAHLLRAAHVKNTAVEEGVYTMERRLYTRRHGKVPHATTFYDTHESLQAERKGRLPSKVVSPVAKKKKERQERIQKKNNELELGYTPHALSLKELGPEDIEAVRKQCRHLRVSPCLQQHFYSLDTDLCDSVTSAT